MPSFRNIYLQLYWKGDSYFVIGSSLIIMLVAENLCCFYNFLNRVSTILDRIFENG